MVYESYEGNMENSNEEDDRRIYNKDWRRWWLGGEGRRKGDSFWRRKNEGCDRRRWKEDKGKRWKGSCGLIWIIIRNRKKDREGW